MGKIKDIHVELHELPDFEKGIQAERERILKELNEMADECLKEHYYAEAGGHLGQGRRHHGPHGWRCCFHGVGPDSD